MSARETKVFLVPKGRSQGHGGEVEGLVSLSGQTNRLNLKGNTRQMMVERFGKSFQAVQILTTSDGPKRFWIRPSSADAPESRSIYAEKSIGISNLPDILNLKLSGVVEMKAAWDDTQKALMVFADKSKPSKSHQATAKKSKIVKASPAVSSEVPETPEDQDAPDVEERVGNGSVASCMPRM